MSREKTLRARATVLLVRQGKVLLVRERNNARYWLPGGAIRRNEGSEQAAARELWDEVGLRVTKSNYIGEYRGRYNHHYVFEVEADGEVSLTGKELSDYLWWDQQHPVELESHVQRLLTMRGKKKAFRWPWSKG